MSLIKNNTPSCADDDDPASLPVDTARQRIIDSVQPVNGHMRLPIRQALDHILAEAITSRVNVPNQTNSAMDGYAVNAASLPAKGNTARLANIGTSWAGRPFDETPAAAQCVRIMTGACMPAGTDTVIMQEHVDVDGDTILIDDRHRAGQNVRQAGEDIAIGQTVLHPGRRLQPADLGLLASCGTAEVAVFRRLRVAFFSTGDELRSLGQPLEQGAIYDSNRYSLYGLLSRLPVDIIDMGVVRDTREATRSAFEQAAKQADVLITSGGVSVGDADFVTETLEAMGQVNFWKVAMKPGRPLAFGSVGDCLFFGLPGNPVSVMVTFMQFVLPALKRCMGEMDWQPLTLKAISVDELRKRPGRTEFQRGRIFRDESGEIAVSSTGRQGSGILSSMHEANGFIVLPQDASRIEAGDRVDVQLFDSIL